MSLMRLPYSTLLALVVITTALVHANPVYPVPDWEVASPESQGMDSKVLQDASELARKSSTYCLVATRHGRLVGEWYWWGHDQNKAEVVWSTSKSVTAMIMGIMEMRGELHANDPLSKYIPEFIGTPSQNITIRSVLTMDSGRYYDPIADFVTPTTKDDQTEYAMSLPQQWKPDTVHQYAQMAFQLLDRVVVNAVGRNIAEYAKEHLFQPLGMRHTMWDTDRAGNPLTYAGVRTSCRDLAKFAHLMLHRGVWANGKRFWTEDFHQRAIAPSPLNRGKGFCWSLKSTYWGANGLGGQAAYVGFNNGILMTRIGFTAADGKPGRVWNKILESVQDM